jgi:hypothetical protein
VAGVRRFQLQARGVADLSRRLWDGGGGRFVPSRSSGRVFPDFGITGRTLVGRSGAMQDAARAMNQENDGSKDRSA